MLHSKSIDLADIRVYLLARQTKLLIALGRELERQNTVMIEELLKLRLNGG